MKNVIIILILIFSPDTIYSQSNDDLEAQYHYTIAEENYMNDQFTDCILNCEKAIIKLGKPNHKILFLLFSGYNKFLEEGCCPCSILNDSTKIKGYINFYFKDLGIKNQPQEKNFITRKFKDDYAEYLSKGCADTKINHEIAAFAKLRTNAVKSKTGLEYVIIEGKGRKPANGTTVYFHYALYFEDGSLIDSSYEDVNRAYGKYDANRAALNGYQAFPFEAGKKEGMIPGFLEGLSLMSYGDKALLFIPFKLGYAEKGAGKIIPPNTNLIMKVELLEALQNKK